MPWISGGRHFAMLMSQGWADHPSLQLPRADGKAEPTGSTNTLRQLPCVVPGDSRELANATWPRCILLETGRWQPPCTPSLALFLCSYFPALSTALPASSHQSFFFFSAGVLSMQLSATHPQHHPWNSAKLPDAREATLQAPKMLLVLQPWAQLNSSASQHEGIGCGSLLLRYNGKTDASLMNGPVASCVVHRELGRALHWHWRGTFTSVLPRPLGYTTTPSKRGTCNGLLEWRRRTSATGWAQHRCRRSKLVCAPSRICRPTDPSPSGANSTARALLCAVRRSPLASSRAPGSFMQ